MSNSTVVVDSLLERIVLLEEENTQLIEEYSLLVAKYATLNDTIKNMDKTIINIVQTVPMNVLVQLLSNNHALLQKWTQ